MYILFFWIYMYFIPLLILLINCWFWRVNKIVFLITINNTGDNEIFSKNGQSNLLKSIPWSIYDYINTDAENLKKKSANKFILNHVTLI